MGSVRRAWKRLSLRGRIYFWISLVGVVLVVATATVYALHASFADAWFPNLIAEWAGLFVTVVVVERLLSRHEETRARELRAVAARRLFEAVEPLWRFVVQRMPVHDLRRFRDVGPFNIGWVLMRWTLSYESEDIDADYRAWAEASREAHERMTEWDIQFSTLMTVELRTRAARIAARVADSRDRAENPPRWFSTEEKRAFFPGGEVFAIDTDISSWLVFGDLDWMSVRAGEFWRRTVETELQTREPPDAKDILQLDTDIGAHVRGYMEQHPNPELRKFAQQLREVEEAAEQYETRTHQDIDRQRREALARANSFLGLEPGDGAVPPNET